MGSVVASGAHDHIFCSELMFYQRNSSPRAAREKVDNVEEKLEREKEVSKAFQINDQTILLIRSPEFYSSDRRQSDLIHALVLGREIYFWRKEVTKATSLHMIDHNATEELACQQPRRTDLTTNIPRVPQEKATYLDKGTGSCEAGNVEATAEKLVVDEKLGWNAKERKRSCKGVPRKYKPHGEGVRAARPSEKAF